MSQDLRIGIDLGGSKIEGIVIDAVGRELARRRIPTPSGDYRGTIEAVTTLVRELERPFAATARVGIGTPGAVSPARGVIKNANSTCLNGRPFHEDMAESLGRPVRIANDADCFTLSEATDGAAAGAAIVFGVILGTGVGGGIAVEGRLLRGPNAITGEWGHNPLPCPEGLPPPDCYCGRTGCIESWLSGPGLAADHERHTGQRLTPPELARRAAAGDEAAEQSLQRYERRLARALAGVINILDPHVIVLGGGLSRLQRLYRNLPPLLQGPVFSDRVDTRILPARHGDSSGVRGAAWLWPGEA